MATFPSSCLNNSPNTILLTPLSPSLPSTFINLPFCPHPSQPPPAAAHPSAVASGSSFPSPAAAHFSAATAGSPFPPPAPAAHFPAATAGSSFPPQAAAAHFSAATAASSFPPPPPGQNDEDISPPCSPPQLRIVEDEKEIFMDR